jgi:AraC-like DNA-binding protein
MDKSDNHTTNMTKVKPSHASTPEWLNRLNPQVHEVWFGQWTPATIEPMRRLIDHELVLFGQGTCEVELADVRIPCPPGTFLIVPPGTPHTTRAGTVPVVRYCAHFDWISSRPQPMARLWSFSPDWYDGRRARPAPGFVPPGLHSGTYDRSSNIEAIMKDMHQRWRSGDVSERSTCRPLLLEVLLRLFTDGRPKNSTPPVEDLAAQTRNLLDGLPYAGHARSIIATLESQGYTYAYLCRQFTSRYGISPLRYVTNRRMEKAKALLQDGGGMKVLAVAAHLGYADVGYFIRTFRRYTSSTPKEYADRFK